MPCLTILVDNSVRAPGLLAQHGFSVYCQVGASRILFDTGADGQVFVANANRLECNLAAVTDLVLSHGHWDHGNGLVAAMDQSLSARIWIPEGALLPRWHRSQSGHRDIALAPSVRERLVVERKRWVNVDGPTEIGPGVWLTGPVPGIRPEWTSRGLVRNQLLEIPDNVPEEQALVIDTPEGLVVVVGCAHFGVFNLLETVCRILPGRAIRALVGGLHLESAPQTDLDALAQLFVQHRVKQVVPCHCSGWAAANWLQSIGYADAVPGRVGMKLDFGDTSPLQKR